MNVVTWLVIGGLVGWLASAAMQIYAPERIYLNVAVGVVGAVFSGWLLPPLLRISSINPGSLNIGGVFVSCLGAVVLLAIVDLGRRSAARIKR